MGVRIALHQILPRIDCDIMIIEDPISLATPPESIRSLPATPPATEERGRRAVERIIQAVKRIKAGKAPVSSWNEFPLDPEGYKTLLQNFESDSDESLWGFVNDRLHLDYFHPNKLVIRMPKAIHESLIASVVFELAQQLKRIAEGKGLSADFARAVHSLGSTTLEFDEPEYGRHDPDGQFQHKDAKYPGVVIEVGYTQDPKDLSRLADDYILGSNGDIRAVICISLDYKTEGEATLSVWEPQNVSDDSQKTELGAVQVVADQSFRNHNGNPNEDAKIDLHLWHFATDDFSKTHGALEDNISISTKQMCEYLDLGVEKARKQREGTGRRGSQHWDRKRPRQVTPAESIDEHREKRFREAEDRALRGGEEDDSSYKASSSFENE